MTTLAKLDTYYKIETPEGINLLFRPASPIIRSIALLIDILVQIGIAIVFTIIIQFFRSYIGLKAWGYLLGFIFIFLFLLYWWYFVLFEVLNNGQSLGKRFCNIKVIHDDGTPISWTSSILRNLLRSVDILPSFSYGLGLITSLTSKEFKRLGDIAAGTLVVYNEEKPISNNIPSVSAVACPFSLTLQEQQIILTFAERNKTLSAERRLELASILSQYFQLNNNQTEERLYQIAQYLLGTDQAQEISSKL